MAEYMLFLFYFFPHPPRSNEVNKHFKKQIVLTLIHTHITFVLNALALFCEMDNISSPLNSYQSKNDRIGQLGLPGLSMVAPLWYVVHNCVYLVRFLGIKKKTECPWLLLILVRIVPRPTCWINLSLKRNYLWETCLW